MIEIRIIDGHDCPELICDSCREKVGLKDWIYWRSPKLDEGHSANVLCFHDPYCLLKVHPPSDFSCMKVEEFIFYLCRNLGYPASAARR